MMPGRGLYGAVGTPYQSRVPSSLVAVQRVCGNVRVPGCGLVLCTWVGLGWWDGCDR